MPLNETLIRQCYTPRYPDFRHFVVKCHTPFWDDGGEYAARNLQSPSNECSSIAGIEMVIRVIRVIRPMATYGPLDVSNCWCPRCDSESNFLEGNATTSRVPK